VVIFDGHLLGPTSRAGTKQPNAGLNPHPPAWPENLKENPLSSVFVVHHQMTSVGIVNLCRRKSCITIPAINFVVVVTHFSIPSSFARQCRVLDQRPHQPAPFANDPVRGPPLSASREDVKALINDPIDIID
jgi:hypothetical protein